MCFRNLFECFCVCLFFPQIVDGEWALGDSQMVPALFLSSTALECQLPLKDLQPADLHPPVNRWQIKASQCSYNSITVNKHVQCILM